MKASHAWPGSPSVSMATGAYASPFANSAENIERALERISRFVAKRA